MGGHHSAVHRVQEICLYSQTPLASFTWPCPSQACTLVKHGDTPSR